MLFATLELSRQLERSEGMASASFVEARARLWPLLGACWIEHAGAFGLFDGPDSPITQTFCLGLFEPATPAALDVLEGFFAERGAPVFHEVSPLAGIETHRLLAERGYRPVEFTSVLYREIEAGASVRPLPEGVSVRVVGLEEADEWARVGAQGWASEMPELESFLLEIGQVNARRAGGFSFLGEYRGERGAAGALGIHGGVAHFSGASTIPAFRRKGLQSALLDARLRFAAESGCRLAVMGASPGSNSQRNAERNGFRIAYTRVKWGGKDFRN